MPKILKYPSGGIIRHPNGKAFRRTIAADLSSNIQLNFSFQPGPSQGDFWTNIAHRGWARVAEGSGGVDLYDNSELHEQGYLDKAGKLVSAPSDAFRVLGFTIMEHATEAASYFNGQTLVIEIAGGRIGDGGSVSFQGLGGGASVSDQWDFEDESQTGDGTTTTFTVTGGAGLTADQIRVEIDGTLQTPTTDYTVADNGADLDVTFGTAPTNGAALAFLCHRTEYSITDATTMDTVLTRVDWADYTQVSNAYPAAYWKKDEADYRDIPNNPYKAIRPEIRDHFDKAHVVRWMDIHGPIMSCGLTHWNQWAKLDDATYSNAMKVGTNNRNGAIIGHIARQGFPIEVALSWAEQYDKVPWIHIPPGYCSFIRPGSFIELSTNDCRFYFDDYWIDPSTVQIDTQPTNGECTLDLANQSIIYNPLSGANPLVKGSVGQVDTDVCVITADDWQGNPQTFNLEIRSQEFGSGFAPDGSYFQSVPNGEEMWPSNKAWFEDSAKWADIASAFVDTLQNFGFSSSRKLMIEPCNEEWNQAAAFVDHRRWMKGVANAYTQETGYGVAIYLGYFRKAVEDELATRQLSYNIEWVCASNREDPDGLSTHSTEAKYAGHQYFWETIQGLTPQQATAKQADYVSYVTMYYSNAWHVTSSDNISNIWGAPLAGSAFTDEVLSRLASDEAQLFADLVTWMQDDTNAWSRNSEYILNLWDQHKTVSESYGGKFGGAYEGGSHDTSHTANVLVNDANFKAAWKSRMEGSEGAAMWNDFCQRAEEHFPDGILVCRYGGTGSKGLSSGSWNHGPIELPYTPEMQAVVSWGPQ